MEPFCILVVIALLGAYVKTHQKLHLQLVNFIVWVKYFNKYKFYMVSPLANKHVWEIMLTLFFFFLTFGFGQLFSLRVPLCPGYENSSTNNFF